MRAEARRALADNFRFATIGSPGPASGACWPTLDSVMMSGWILLVGAAILVLLGLGLGLGLSRGVERAVKRRDDRIRELEAEAQHGQDEQQRVMRLIERMKSETRGLSSFMVFMPEFARQLIANHEPAKFAPIIGGIIDQMFAPRQIAVFYADDRGEPRLDLA